MRTPRPRFSGRRAYRGRGVHAPVGDLNSHGYCGLFAISRLHISKRNWGAKSITRWKRVFGERQCRRKEPEVNRRTMFDGVLWGLRTGAPGRSLPPRYDPHQTAGRLATLLLSLMPTKINRFHSSPAISRLTANSFPVAPPARRQRITPKSLCTQPAPVRTEDWSEQRDTSREKR